MQLFVHIAYNEIWSEIWIYFNSEQQLTILLDGQGYKINKIGTYMTKNSGEELGDRSLKISKDGNNVYFLCQYSFKRHSLHRNARCPV